MYVTGRWPDGDIGSSRVSDKYSAKYMSAMSWNDGSSDGTNTGHNIKLPLVTKKTLLHFNQQLTGNCHHHIIHIGNMAWIATRESKPGYTDNPWIFNHANPGLCTA